MMSADAFTYLLKVNLYWILFYTGYWLLLRNHTFFRLNRFYLLGTLLLSLALPAIQFTETVRVMPLDVGTVSQTADYLVEPVAQQFNYINLLIIIYSAGAVYMLFKLLKGFYNLYHLVKQGESLKFEEYTLILLSKVVSKTTGIGSFSFFNLLIVSNNDYEYQFDTILQHEQIHIKQVHSLDILFIEILKVLFWFNPVLWCYKFSMREVHEFLADQEAENRDVYAEFLVSYAQRNSVDLITNHFFNSSMLKDRIKMIYKNRTSHWLLYKYVMIIPIIVVTILMTAARKQLVVVSDPHITRQLPIQTIQNKQVNAQEGKKMQKEKSAGNASKAASNYIRSKKTVKRQKAMSQDSLKLKKTYVMNFTNYNVNGLETENLIVNNPQYSMRAPNFVNYSIQLFKTEQLNINQAGVSFYNAGVLKKEQFVLKNNKLGYKFRKINPALIDTLIAPK